jgi:hypothetical protein
MSAVPTYTAVHRSAIDELLEGYVSWREACQAVWLAYERWIGSDRGERALAYATYLAALDREERAARTYAQHTAHVARISPLTRTGHGRGAVSAGWSPPCWRRR